MTEATFFRHGDALYAADPLAEEMIKSLPQGKRVMGKFWSPRNAKQSAMWWTMLKLVSDNSTWASSRALNDAILVNLKYVDTRRTLRGQAFMAPKSIAFESMAQDEFGEFFKAGIIEVQEHVIKDLDNKELLAEVEEMLRDKRYEEAFSRPDPTAMVPTRANLALRVHTALSSGKTEDDLNSIWKNYGFNYEYNELAKTPPGRSGKSTTVVTAEQQAILRNITGIHKSRVKGLDTTEANRRCDEELKDFNLSYHGKDGPYGD